MSIRKTLYIAVPFLLLVTTFGFIIHSFFDIAISTLVQYVMTQSFVVMIPGMVCVKYLFDKIEKSVVHWIFLSYAFGYITNIVQYLVIWGLHLQQYAAVIVMVASLIFIILWFYKPIDVEFEHIRQDDFLLVFIFVIYEMINIICYSGNNISPYIGIGGIDMARDIQFWCSNAVALKNSFLPQSAYFFGTTFFYHYFSSMHIAFISQISGISVFDIACTLFSFGKCILLIGSLNYLVDRYKFGNEKYIFYLSILFMTGWEDKSIVTYGWHLNYNPFGFDIGFSFGLLFLALMLDVWDDKSFDVRKFVSIILVWLVLSGTKGPIAVLMILIPGFVCIKWLCQKRFQMAYTYGIAILGIFTLVNIYCVGIIRILNHTAEAQTDSISGFRTVYEVISETPYGVHYRNLLPALIWYAYNTHPFLFVISVTNTIVLIWMFISKAIRINDCQKICVLFFTVFCGFVIGRFYNAGGRSEMYFTMTTYIPCLAYNLEVYRETLDREVLHYGWRNALYNVIILSASFIGIYCWGFTDFQGGIIVPLSNGYNKIIGNWSTMSASSSFSKREADACSWIRNNTKRDSIVQSNRFIAYPSGSYFNSIFSERIQYLEETFLIYYCELDNSEVNTESQEAYRRGEIIKCAYGGDISSLNQLVDDGVDYFIQDNLICENKLEGMGLVKVYDQNDIVIYAALQK